MRGSSGTSANHWCIATDLRAEESPGGGARLSGAGSNAGREDAPTGTRADGGESRTAARGGKPLESESRTWLRGETNPQGRWRRKPSRTCETSRAERSGGVGSPAACGLRRLMSRRGNETPRKELHVGRREAGVARKTLERNGSAREDEAGCESVRRTVRQ